MAYPRDPRHALLCLRLTASSPLPSSPVPATLAARRSDVHVRAAGAHGTDGPRVVARRTRGPAPACRRRAGRRANRRCACCSCGAASPRSIAPRLQSWLVHRAWQQRWQQRSGRASGRPRLPLRFCHLLPISGDSTSQLPIAGSLRERVSPRRNAGRTRLECLRDTAARAAKLGLLCARCRRPAARWQRGAACACRQWSHSPLRRPRLARPACSFPDQPTLQRSHSAPAQTSALSP